MVLLAICEDPRDFYGHNLVDILYNHLTLFSEYLRNNKLAYAVIVLALCKSFENVDNKYLQELSTTPGKFAIGVGECEL